MLLNILNYSDYFKHLQRKLDNLIFLWFRRFLKKNSKWFFFFSKRYFRIWVHVDVKCKTLIVILLCKTNKPNQIGWKLSNFVIAVFNIEGSIQKLDDGITLLNKSVITLKKLNRKYTYITLHITVSVFLNKKLYKILFVWINTVLFS